MRGFSKIFKMLFLTVFVTTLMVSVLVDLPPAVGESTVPPFMEGPLVSIYILNNGTVVGTDKVVFSENVYRFTANIKGYIVVQKDNVIIDGAGFTLSGEGSLGIGSYAVSNTTGINLLYTTGVTIRNLNIVNFINGITPAPNAIVTGNFIAYNKRGIAIPSNANITNNYIEYNEIGIMTAGSLSKNNRITGNTITNNRDGVKIMNAGRTDDVISDNNFTGNEMSAISLMGCGSVTVSDNSITNTMPGIGSNITAGPMGAGINMVYAQNCIIIGNYIADNNYGLTFTSTAKNNRFILNDFINREQVALIPTSRSALKLDGLVEMWDNGAEGNYWSDYLTKYPNANELDNSGIGDTAYTIDPQNIDHYPLMEPANAPPSAEPSANAVLTGRPSLVGSQVKIEGTLTYNGAGVAFAALQISYSIDEAASWNEVAVVNTDVNGDYSATWLPPDRGTYEIRVSWEGNATIPQASTTVFVVMTAMQDDEQISVASNSTITAFNFNADAQEISFNVDGPSGTTGFVRIYVSKGLFQNIANASVYMDGIEMNYSTSSTDESWILYFTYSHSTHSVTVNLSQGVTEMADSILLWLATGAVLFGGACIDVGVLLYLRKRK